MENKSSASHIKVDKILRGRKRLGQLFSEHDSKYYCCCDCTVKKGAEAASVVVVLIFLVVTICVIVDTAHTNRAMILSISITLLTVVTMSAVSMGIGLANLIPRAFIPFLVVLGMLSLSLIAVTIWMVVKIKSSVDVIDSVAGGTNDPRAVQHLAYSSGVIDISRRKQATAAGFLVVRHDEASLFITITSICSVLCVWWFYICIKAYRYVRDKRAANRIKFENLSKPTIDPGMALPPSMAPEIAVDVESDNEELDADSDPNRRPSTTSVSASAPVEQKTEYEGEEEQPKPHLTPLDPV